MPVLTELRNSVATTSSSLFFLQRFLHFSDKNECKRNKYAHTHTCIAQTFNLASIKCSLIHTGKRRNTGWICWWNQTQHCSFYRPTHKYTFDTYPSDHHSFHEGTLGQRLCSQNKRIKHNNRKKRMRGVKREREANEYDLFHSISFHCLPISR